MDKNHIHKVHAKRLFGLRSVDNDDDDETKKQRRSTCSAPVRLPIPIHFNKEKKKQPPRQNKATKESEQEKREIYMANSILMCKQKNCSVPLCFVSVCNKFVEAIVVAVFVVIATGAVDAI